MKVYLSPQEQIEAPGVGALVWRNILNVYINPSAGECFDEIDNPARRYSICLVTARPETYAALETDSRIVPLMEIDATPEQLTEHLNRLLSSIPLAFRNAIQTALEERGISVAWLGASNTVRDLLRYLLRIHFLSQRFDGEGSENLRQLIREHLDTTVAQIPQVVRTTARSWIEARGLSTAWMTNQTTIRQILHYIVTNLGFGVINLGVERF